MAPATGQNDKKTTRDSVSTNNTVGEEKNPKRQCTTKATAEDNDVPDNITSTTELFSTSRDKAINDGGWDRGGGDDDDDTDQDSNKLPTTIQLSKELCRIQDPAKYSNDEIVSSLGKFISWSGTKDTDYLKRFFKYGGDTKVLDFLTATMNNSNCKGEIRMKFIDMAARVISRVCGSAFQTNINKDIVSNSSMNLLLGLYILLFVDLIFSGIL